MLDEIFEMFQDRSRKGRGSSSGGLMGKIGRILEGDSDDRSRSSDDRRYDDRAYRDRRDDHRGSGYDDREYGNQDRRFGDRPREDGYDVGERGFARDDSRYSHPEDRRFDARRREDDREFRRRDDDDFVDDRFSPRERKRRAFDFELDD